MQKDAEAMAAGLKKAGGAKVGISRWDNDHSYSDHRIAMETAVTRWLTSHAGAR
jgi:5-enolpyruvylshikimate-3-phosphate synthase